MKFIDKIPTLPLAVIAVLLGLAPFVPEPHLLEKLKMLASGELAKPIDILDLIMHATPAILLIIKLSWNLKKKG
ncbi:MAG: RND transporter [Gammaproteobacteria bacterium]|nr:RND transporter [Gammaproteobacteria bacterium]